jgi:hypothetical protein
MRERLKTIAFAAVVAAFTVGGLAIAQDDKGDSGSKGTTVQRDHLLGPGPGGPGLHGDRNVTYSETHLREDGKDVTVRVDHGKVTASDSDSITIERNDGESVEIAVDGGTKVLTGPGKDDAKAEDIASGKRVMAVRKSGSDAAEVVAVAPKHPPRIRFRGAPGGDRFGGRGEMPPPPPMDGGQ